MRLPTDKREVVVNCCAQYLIEQIGRANIASLPNHVITDHIVEMVDDIETEIDNILFSEKDAVKAISKKSLTQKWWE